MDKAGMEPTREGRTGDAIRDAAEDAKHELSRLGDEVKEKGATLFHEQRDTASRQISSVAKALEAGAGSLDEDGQERLATYTRDAADRVRRLGDEVRERDFEVMLNSARDYARENPAVIIGGAAVLGFVLSRFLKSSSSREYDHADEELAFSPTTTEPPMDTATGSFEGMAPGASSLGESARSFDEGRRFGNGTDR